MRLVGFELEPDALVEMHAQQVVDDIEARLAVGIIDAANVAEQREAAFRVVAQESQHPQQRLALDRSSTIRRSGFRSR